MHNPEADGPSATFVRLGPFYRLQKRLGLLSDTDLAASRRALLFVALASLPMMLLGALDRLGLGIQSGHTVFEDFTVYAFGLAVGAFVFMEQTSERRMKVLVGQLEQRAIIQADGQDEFKRCVARMERRTGSCVAEVLLLVLAYAMVYVWIVRNANNLEGGTWIAQLVDGSIRLTLAGWWAAIVALPLYFFLCLRWLWRFCTWGLLLRDIAKCKLRLVATHPDRCGGLAFLGQYPRTYVLFVFAQSAVVSSTVLKHVIYGGASLGTFKYALLGMVVCFVLAFVLPLLVFAPILHSLKRRGLSHYGLLASQHNFAFEARWVDASPKASGADLLGSPDPSSLADFAGGYDLVKRMLPIPFTKESVLPILLAAVVPMAGVAATQMPIDKVLSMAKLLVPF